jgi:rod shape determining protein RodA
MFIWILYLVNFVMFMSFNNLSFINTKVIIIYIIKNLFCLGFYYVGKNVNINYLKNLSFYIYVTCLGLLIFVHFLGIIGLGAKRWINLGFFYLQPSEFMKICLPIYLSDYLSEKLLYSKELTFSIVIKYFAIILLPIILIIIEPDLGTGIILILICSGLLFISGLKRIYIILICGSLVAMSPVIWFKMYDYQKKRILTFINGGNIKKEGYQIQQSKIAIGSGGLFGKGFLKGTQFRYKFLPKPDTDFIFSCICEEWGFLGGFFIISLYFSLVCLAINTSLWKESLYEKLLVFAIGVYIFFSFFFNIGMTTSFLPTVGVPLPLLSRGGSSAATFLFSTGLLFNIRKIKK